MTRTLSMSLLVLAAGPALAHGPVIHVKESMSPPTWALLQREVLRMSTAGCREFFAKYFDERGYLQCVERWGGDDGPDDAIENCNDWPILHALGIAATGFTIETQRYREGR